MRRKLTKLTVEKLKPPKAGKRLEIWDTVVPGFGLRITDNDVRSFFVMYRHGRGAVVHDKEGRIIGGRRLRRLTLGNAKIMELDEARRKARAALGRAEEGEDPAQARDEVPTTFRDFVGEYLKRAKPNLAARTYAEKERLFERELLPRWGGLAVSEVTTSHVANLLDEMVERGAGVRANRTLADIRALFNAGFARRAGITSPVAHMEMPTEESPREQALSDQELTWFWQASGTLGWPFGPLFRLLALTGQRREQVRALEWREVDLTAKRWVIPGSRMKGGREHEVALSDLACEALAEVQRTAAKLAGLQDAALAFTTNGKTPVSGFSRAKARLDEAMEKLARKARGLPEDDDAYRKKLKLGPKAELPRLIPEWRLHDLRRTLVHGLAQLKFPPHVADKVLAHSTGAISGVAAIYNRYEYSDERRDALAAWGNKIAALIGRRAAVVRRLRA